MPRKIDSIVRHSCWKETAFSDKIPSRRRRGLGSGRSVAQAVRAVLETRIEAIEATCAELCSNSAACVTCSIASLGDGLSIVKYIPVTIVQEDGDFIATFYDANINESGDDQVEAFEMLKSAIIQKYRYFSSNESRLGKEPARQLSVLREFIREE